MRKTRRSIAAWLAAGTLFGKFGLRPVAARQGEADCSEAEPATPPEAMERITLQPIAIGLPLGAPDQQLSLYRFTLPPGNKVDPHRHPGATILQVEAGALAYTLIDGTVELWRGDANQTQAVAVTEPGTEVVMRPGDAVFYDAETVHSAHNSESEPVLVLAVTLMATDQPSTIPVG